MTPAQEVLIYSTPSCPFCKQAKDYMSSKNIKFKEIDVASNKRNAREMMDLSGQMGVPQIVIGDTVIVGFDQKSIDEALR
jgi:glutaredoxin-like YruB-family protein